MNIEGDYFISNKHSKVVSERLKEIILYYNILEVEIERNYSVF